MEMVSVRLTYLQPKKGFVWNNPSEVNYIDKNVFSKLKMLNILPSDVCSDQEFVRRSYLDACGILPTPEETKKFLEDKSPTKRSKLVDELIGRQEFSDFWTLKWSDVLRSSRKTVQIKGIHVFQQWLKAKIEKNVGIDQIVKELIDMQVKDLLSATNEGLKDLKFKHAQDVKNSKEYAVRFSKTMEGERNA